MKPQNMYTNITQQKYTYFLGITYHFSKWKILEWSVRSFYHWHECGYNDRRHMKLFIVKQNQTMLLNTDTGQWLVYTTRYRLALTVHYRKKSSSVLCGHRGTRGVFLCTNQGLSWHLSFVKLNIVYRVKEWMTQDFLKTEILKFYQ